MLFLQIDNLPLQEIIYIYLFGIYVADSTNVLHFYNFL
jgi:hypothetical protein